MPRTTIQTNGAVCYRSKLMALASAAAFARCLSGNASRFQDVEIIPNKTADKAHVRFRPVSAERQQAIHSAEQEAREIRAALEGGDYVYVPDSDDVRRSWVFNPISGETYDMWMGHCSCPDKKFRCQKAGLHCKHEIERNRRYVAGTLYSTDKVTPGIVPAVAA